MAITSLSSATDCLPFQTTRKIDLPFPKRGGSPSIMWIKLVSALSVPKPVDLETGGSTFQGGSKSQGSHKSFQKKTIPRPYPRVLRTC